MGIRNKAWLFLPVVVFFTTFITALSIEADTIFTGQSLSVSQTITSKGGNFELGFFIPNKSPKQYVGIWYKRIPVKTVVWVANRDEPLLGPYSSELKLSEDGNLVLFDSSKNQIWSTSLTSNTRNSTKAVLLDSGNLVLYGSSDFSSVIWQSFDHLTDTWMPGGKIGFNQLTKEEQNLISWRTPEDPASGTLSVGVELNRASQNFLLSWHVRYWPKANNIWWSYNFSHEISLVSNICNFTIGSNINEFYLKYSVYDNSIITRFVIDFSGQMKQFVWLETSQEWDVIWSLQLVHVCENFNPCGENASCNQNGSVLCQCLPGYEPKFLTDWNLGYWSGGCASKAPFQCNYGGKDSFSVMHSMQVPESSSVTFIVRNIEECKLACLRNCSCIAYKYEVWCYLWQGELLNLQQLSYNNTIGSDIHVRHSISKRVTSRGKKVRIVWVTVCAFAGAVTLLGIVLLVVWRCRRRQFISALEAIEDSLVLFRYRDLRSSTKNFSEKLGGGGFGSVFKGTLPNSAAIAVKKLECLRKGEQQFRAEVSTLGIIQHANLVRLRGFCAEGNKRFLVYDYMLNGSLDSHLFRKDSNILDWKTRYQIALGTARGLAYLHDECRDCIVHCDIKPGNILLDAGFNAKLADFGLAKLFGRDLSRILTTMRGTRGYIAPEWISGAAITAKADVYSYGMMLFEVISGRKNLNISEDGMVDYLPTRAVNQLSKGEVFSLLDYKLEGNADMEELTRACRVACWCIQDDEKDRPSMRYIVQILEGIFEMDVPPIPRFLQAIVNNSAE